MVQIMTPYLKKLEGRERMLGTGKTLAETSVTHSLRMGRGVPGKLNLLEWNHRPSRVRAVGAIQNKGTLWAKIWAAPAGPMPMNRPGVKVLINWTMTRGTGKLEKDRRRIKFLASRETPTTLKALTWRARMTELTGDKAIDLTR
jgi:hypothetical protein